MLEGLLACSHDTVNESKTATMARSRGVDLLRIDAVEHAPKHAARPFASLVIVLADGGAAADVASAFCSCRCCES